MPDGLSIPFEPKLLLTKPAPRLYAQKSNNVFRLFTKLLEIKQPLL